MFPVQSINPIHFAARPRRKASLVRFVDKPTGRREAKAAANEAELRRLEADNRLGVSGTAKDIYILEIDRESGENRKIPATLDRRTGQFTGYTFTPIGLLIQDGDTPPVAQIILPGQEGTPTRKQLILPDEYDNSPKPVQPKGSEKPAKLITLGEETGDDTGIDHMLRVLADQQRRHA